MTGAIDDEIRVICVATNFEPRYNHSLVYANSITTMPMCRTMDRGTKIFTLFCSPSSTTTTPQNALSFSALTVAQRGRLEGYHALVRLYAFGYHPRGWIASITGSCLVQHHAVSMRDILSPVIVLLFQRFPQLEASTATLVLACRVVLQS